uniref:LITAF domain-containing protein n=1 Tax=Ditylenchus dipsaci TaxID=166011 RepID=A0A915CZB0_9BILA
MKTLITYPQTPNEKNSAIEISIRSDVPVPVNSHKKFGCSPVTTTCYRCNQVILSKVRYSAGLLTWILFVVCLFTGKRYFYTQGYMLAWLLFDPVLFENL